LRDVVPAEIRAARADEAEVLLLIQRAAAVGAFGHIFPQDRYPFPEAAIRDDWRAALDDPMVEVYVAEVDEDVVGSVSVGYGFLRTLYVVPGHWGRGRGAALHDHGLDRLRRLDVAEARLWTLAENTSARRFYEDRGWTETGETRVVPFPPNPLDVEYALPL
jgi:GNAT superfamily N-acetyltransferase